ncbi:MAG: hypothetical protein LBT53_01385 [Puniceicoccales bacterium]|jgi:hypothetical protein|nr:hypothetical protein [Puniceicoccales bacterium]
MKEENMTYSNAIEQVMLHNNYVAPLKLLYKEVWNYKDISKIKGKTPIATIQERVQRDNRFTKIGLGVYALTDKLDLLEKQKIPKTEKERTITRHGEMQGMLLEIGNSRKEVQETYTNDKKFVFQNKTLGSLATLQIVPPFTYEKIIRESATFTDVIWFNERLFPSKIFEVENSTDFRDAFVKFMELQDFTTEFVCVSPSGRKTKFDREIDKNAFRPIRDRIRFLSYEEIENDYNATLTKLYI